MSDEPNETKCRRSDWKRSVPMVVRVVLVVFLLNGTLGVLAQLPVPEESVRLAVWLNGLNLREALLGMASPSAVCSSVHASTVGLALGVGLCGLVLMVLAALLRLTASCAILLALALIYGTLRQSGADLPQEIRSGQPLGLLAVMILFGLPLVFGSIRWGMLLSVQGIHLPFPHLFRLTLIGHFFNIALPGAVTGDLLKMGYVMKHDPERKTEAVLSIVVDRVLGVLGLCIVAGVVVLLMLGTILGFEDWALKGAVLAVGLGSVGGALGILAVELRGAFMRMSPVARCVQWVAAHLPHGIVKAVARLVAATEQYRNHRRVVIKALLLAVGVHCALGLSLFLAGRSLGESRLGIQDYFLTTQVANCAGAIPVTPGGLGTRDAVAAAYLTELGARPREKAAVIQVIVTIAMVLWGLIGATVFVCSPRTMAVDPSVIEMAEEES